MDELDQLRHEVRDLHRERGELASRLAESDQRLRHVEQELLETNRGVVALYAELDDQARQLEQLSDLKSRFLSYVSHEFRAPLASIRGMTRLLLQGTDGTLGPEQQKQVLFVQSSAEELFDMVSDQLDLAKIEAGRITISAEWFDLVDLFATLRGMFRPLLLREGVRLVFEEPRDVPQLYTDHQKLAQILRNFIANALKFTEEGEVRVRAALDGDDRVTFSVEDTGIGIGPDVLPMLFQDFVQVPSPAQRSLRGTGLGLALSKRFAELLGGSVHATSEPGVGSTFSVTIPQRLPAQENRGDEGTR